MTQAQVHPAPSLEKPPLLSQGMYFRQLYELIPQHPADPPSIENAWAVRALVAHMEETYGSISKHIGDDEKTDYDTFVKYSAEISALAHNIPPPDATQVAEALRPLLEAMENRLSAKMDVMENCLGAKIDGMGQRVDLLGNRLNLLGNRLEEVEAGMNRVEKAI